MKCPRCGEDNVKYKQRRPQKRVAKKKGKKKVKGGTMGTTKKFIRDDWTIICPKCGEFDERENYETIKNEDISLHELPKKL